jgi:hypothetical protein
MSQGASSIGFASSTLVGKDPRVLSMGHIRSGADEGRTRRAPIGGGRRPIPPGYGGCAARPPRGSSVLPELARRHHSLALGVRVIARVPPAARRQQGSHWSRSWQTRRIGFMSRRHLTAPPTGARCSLSASPRAGFAPGRYPVAASNPRLLA